MKNGVNGCVEAVGLMGAGASPFLAQAYNNGQYSVPGLVNDAQKQGIPVVPYQTGAAGANDVVVYGNNDHAVLADGYGGHYSNSSSQNQIVHGNNLEEMGGLKPTAIIKTGNNDGNFTFKANDASGKPFFSMGANIRTTNPNEPFDQSSLMEILSQPTRSYAKENRLNYLTQRNYENDLLFLNPDVARWMKDGAKKLVDNRDADLRSEIDQYNQQVRLQQALQLGQLINSSGSVDNRRGYAAMARMFGIDLPTGDDQFVNGSDLLKTQIQVNDAERNYNFKQEQANRAQSNWEKEFALKKAIEDQKLEAAKQKASSGKMYSISDAQKIKEYIDQEYDQLIEKASNGSMTGPQIKQRLDEIDKNNNEILMMIEGEGGGAANAYAQVKKDNTLKILQSRNGPTLSYQDHTWTNNSFSQEFLNKRGG